MFLPPENRPFGEWPEEEENNVVSDKDVVVAVLSLVALMTLGSLSVVLLSAELYASAFFFAIAATISFLRALAVIRKVEQL